MSPQLSIEPGRRQGRVELPYSKSHLHRLLIADYLAGGRIYTDEVLLSSSDDVQATGRCLAALRSAPAEPVLDCGESGATLRFFLPLAMTQVNSACFLAAGRLPERPLQPFLEMLQEHGIRVSGTAFPLRLQGNLQPGEYFCRGDISSQIVTGLLLALPILHGDSQIHLTTGLQSQGYVEMTLQVLRQYGIHFEKSSDGFVVPGNQHFVSPEKIQPESDWSAAACWLAMNKLSSRITLPELKRSSAQPDACIGEMLDRLGGEVDIAQCPDLFPVLAVTAASCQSRTVFRNIRRLRLKESDRVAAIAELLDNLGVKIEITENEFAVYPGTLPWHSRNILKMFGDHRIAMAAAVAATVADHPLIIDNAECVAKSYPGFWTMFKALSLNA